MDLHFVWQAWHLRHWAGSGGGLGRRWGPVTPRVFCVAGVALGDMDLHFVWQAWHLRHWAGSGGGLGVALTTLGWLWWRPWSPLGPCDAAPRLRGRRGTWRRLPSFCVAGVALGDMDFHFVWQAWHSVTWTLTLCGRRGTDGTGLALVAALVAAEAPRLSCVAGVALGDICRRFVWQAWHSVTWTFTLCGRRGVCVAGVALGDVCLRFVWQAWHSVTWTFTLCGRRCKSGRLLGMVCQTRCPALFRTCFSSRLQAWQVGCIG
eukprot:s1409_g4.t1